MDVYSRRLGTSREWELTVRVGDKDRVRVRVGVRVLVAEGVGLSKPLEWERTVPICSAAMTTKAAISAFDLSPSRPVGSRLGSRLGRVKVRVRVRVH